MVETRIGEYGSSGEQLMQTAVLNVAGAVKVVEAELVHHDNKDEFGFLGGGCCNGEQGAKQRSQDNTEAMAMGQFCNSGTNKGFRHAKVVCTTAGTFWIIVP